IPSVFLTAFHGKANGGLAGPRIQHRNANLVISFRQIFRNVQRSVVYGIAGKPFANVHRQDRKSTRLNSSHSQISYADFCLTSNTPRKVGRNRERHYGRGIQLHSVHPPATLLIRYSISEVDDDHVVGRTAAVESSDAPAVCL